MLNDIVLENIVDTSDQHVDGEIHYNKAGVRWKLESVNGVTRPVLRFDGTGCVAATACGLPTGAEPRTMMGWFKPEAAIKVPVEGIRRTYRPKGVNRPRRD